MENSLAAPRYCPICGAEIDYDGSCKCKEYDTEDEDMENYFDDKLGRT